MVNFKTIVKKFGNQGEKTGWTYIEVPVEIAKKINPGVKKSYRVKGKLDKYLVKSLSLLPMGGGDFIITLNATLRKKTGKRKGDKINVSLELDKDPVRLNPELLDCLEFDPEAKNHFFSLGKSHQNYFSSWIESAKTDQTRTKRIAMAVNALSRKFGFPEMLRMNKKDN